ncbi:hepatitis A virus cellular receptor 1-like [Salarias fasciatus]|uniref:hepatitis A virus cellular receptor 1-like n=1 Tax=Salarias fasciatus TaxID=181472 RepID=UPI001176713B|nr:hepatitis A virus cellular receptor 1-like [Salarias fasciatus]
MLLPLLLHAFTCVCVLSAAVSTETVVGVAGQAATLPCRSEAVEQPGVEVCWGTGEPSLFGCHNTVMYSAGSRVTYRKSHRFSVSSSSSLSISDLRQSDSGFYHCRVQLPGLFNDETSSVHLIIVLPRPSPSASETPQLSDGKDQRSLNAPQTTAAQEQSGAVTGQPDSSATEPAVAPVLSSIQKQQNENTLQMFVGNTVRLSFIVFVPAVLLTAAYRVWRLNPRWERNPKHSQSVEEEEEEEEEDSTL